MAIKLTNELFINRVNIIHGENRFSFDKLNYINNSTKVILNCNKHNEYFEIKPDSILKNNSIGCSKCLKEYRDKIHKKPLDVFIKQVEDKFGKDKFGFDKCDYIDSKTNLTLFCKTHNEYFEVTPTNFLRKRTIGCPKCFTEFQFIFKRKPLNVFIEEVENKFGKDRFGFDKCDYINNNTKVEIFCKKHNEYFKVTPTNFLRKDSKGCPKCMVENTVITNNENFISRSKVIYGDKYDYSKTNYINTTEKVTLICNKHNHEFQVTPSYFLSKVVDNYCPICIKEKKPRLSLDEYIFRSRSIHGENTYDYSKVNYINSKKNIELICNKHNHSFLIRADSHLDRVRGCPICANENNISLGEKNIMKLLIENDIKYETQKKFSNCVNINELRFDFYLPDYNLCIEYDGEQHFKSVEYFGGDVGFKQRQINDDIKNKYCKDNNIELIRISYKQKVKEVLKNRFNL